MLVTVIFILTSWLPNFMLNGLVLLLGCTYWRMENGYKNNVNMFRLNTTLFSQIRIKSTLRKGLHENMKFMKNAYVSIK